MMTKFWNLILGLSLLLCIPMIGQPPEALQRSVSWHYQNQELASVLDDISATYAINFTYSKDRISTQTRVYSTISEQSLATALDQLFAETSIRYHAVGHQIVLSPAVDQRLGLTEPRISKISPSPKPLPAPPPQRPTIVPLGALSVALPNRVPSQTLVAKSEGTWLGFSVPADRESDRIFGADFSVGDVDNSRFSGQLSVSEQQRLRVQTSAASAQVVNVSLSLLPGTNEYVQGVELGMIANHTTGNVTGAQVSLGGNKVRGNVTGAQVSGFLNSTDGITEGMQLAGILNVGNHSNALQMAGVGNLNKGNFVGVQSAGLFNYNGGDQAGLQLSGLLNVSEGEANTQVAMVNYAGELRGTQFGLINVSRTTTDDAVAIGLLNLISDGYNRTELRVSHTGLKLNLGLKLGTPKFYNIFQAGVNTYSFPSLLSRTPVWGIGYGIGHAQPWKDRGYLNYEVTINQINERVAWTRRLNVLSQFRFTVDWSLRSREQLSIFFGPEVNLMFSRLYDAEDDRYGSVILRDGSLFDIVDEGSQFSARGRIAVVGGIRF